MRVHFFLIVTICVSVLGCSRRSQSAPTPTGNPASLLATNGELSAASGDHGVQIERGDRVRVRMTSEAFDPSLQVVPPTGQRLQNDDAEGSRNRSEIELVAQQSGRLKIIVGSSNGGRGAYHLDVERLAQNVAPSVRPAETRPRQAPNLAASAPSLLQNAEPQAGGGGGGGGGATPPAARVLPVRVGDRVSGNLTESDATLSEGQFVDYYVLDIAEAQELTFQMQSTALDAFLVVVDAHGERHENDDSGGSHDAQLVVSATPGQYRVACTSYRAGESGSYVLKVLTPRDLATSEVAATAPARGPAFTPVSRRGELRRGDTRENGKYYDVFTFALEAGQNLRIEANARGLDTFLRIRGPGGQSAENDDREPGNLNAGLDYLVPATGRYEVRVTTYSEGETGNYTLDIRSSSAVAAVVANSSQGTTQVDRERVLRGTLARGDQTLASGEFNDAYDLTFAAGTPITLRADSSDFDTYILLRSPSGHQQDNDDVEPNNTNSEVVLHAAEAGTYHVVVTSYRAGESGAYTLRVTPGDSGGGGAGAPGANPGNPSGGTRVWAVSVGITDYPNGINDLPQCANDARRISETLRTQNLTQSNTEFLFTDGQATVSAVRNALTQVVRQAGPDDVVVFFYSGHGGQDTQRRTQDANELDGVNEYLVLYDGRLLDDELGTLFEASHARVSLVALDACFSGGFSKDVVRRAGVVGLFSSEEDVTSAVASRFQAGGYLSHFLRLGMEGQADQDPHDSALTVGELTHFVWQQYGSQASDVRMSEGYQQLVVDRGAVRTGQLLWRSGRQSR